jgi:hypothetical protein
MYEDRMPEGFKSARECAIDEQEAHDWAIVEDEWEYDDDSDEGDE